MSVSRLDIDDDWSFGAGLSDYVDNSNEIAQNVKTRLKFLKSEWVYDTDAGIDWYGILANKSNEATIVRELTRITLATDGVKTLDELTHTVDRTTRKLSATIKYTDIFQTQVSVVI